MNIFGMRDLVEDIIGELTLIDEKPECIYNYKGEFAREEVRNIKMVKIDRLDEISETEELFVAIPDNRERKAFVNSFPNLKYAPAVLGRSATAPARMGAGTIVSNDTKIVKSTKIGKHCIIGSEVIIGKNCIIEDYVTIGEHCKIGSGVVLREGAFISAGTMIASSVEVGEWARTSPHTFVGKDVAPKKKASDIYGTL